jgi:hypothetical protein
MYRKILPQRRERRFRAVDNYFHANTSTSK